MSDSIPKSILDAMSLAHLSWHPILKKGLDEMVEADPDYLVDLAKESYLPTEGRIFAAFAQPLDDVRYVLVGEGPYPRAASATGVCFMDGAVEELWSEKGLSKQVNRATSLRNFIKMLLVAEGELPPDATGGEAIARFSSKARGLGSPFIQTLTELQANLLRHSFLLLNATLVYRQDVAPHKDAKAWRPFLRTVFESLASSAKEPDKELPQLVLWGKIAEQLSSLGVTQFFPCIFSEHPYNLSFIGNQTMQKLFGPMHLLHRQG